MGFIRERIQVATIVAGAFCIHLSLYCLIYHFTMESMTLDVFAMVLSFLLIASEIWYFELFRYIAFIFTIWGKGLTFMALGFCIFYPGVPVAIVGSCLMWLLAVFYFVLYSVLHKSPLPLTAKCRAWTDSERNKLDERIDFLMQGDHINTPYDEIGGSQDQERAGPYAPS